MNRDVADLRLNYTQNVLVTADPDPWVQFQQWFTDACTAPIREPNAMTLATVDAQGYPAARIVLMKGFDAQGIRFFTNMTSTKGQELAHHPQAALVFWWEPLERQVRFRGEVTPLPTELSDAYFRQRPRNSQLGAWASPQSQEIPHRELLEERFAQLEREYSNREIPRPPHWGGYCLAPDSIEFWQGRPSRLHDRIAYTRHPDGHWLQARLAP
ncbi:pyridoxamine 5'-phosphate oxidase [Gloeomargarita lithophora Alchichica-D10]|uniref:Pyridoxine/pyridoxamine 5'-phosphate oxidase n=1 Tax=Gloeomargarita lithophora Alchichica-D10 TaxID=1188229 RepID=A0A1J0ACU2_9CYAN|nr:pyridoxamine 5'-phosphate oxidase [Gloeomargarita lithophora]APB33735.1 pyridoxamine 5'-phosphate oxidase [Gloeomargarita lithophora Alchichica-D10]